MTLCSHRLYSLGLDAERERALTELNITLAWLQEAIVISVICYKKTQHGCLPSKVRRLFYKAVVERFGFISTVQADYEHLVLGMVRHKFDLNPYLRLDTAGMVRMIGT
ncbi:hypothetical protein WJX77_003774 [Trebouxia sp. C0004]